MAKKISNKQLIKIIKDDFQEPYKHEWEQVAECIVTDQVPASDIAKFFQNKALCLRTMHQLTYA